MLPPRPPALPPAPRSWVVRAAAAKIRHQNDPRANALVAALAIGVIFALLLAGGGFYLGVGDAVTALLPYAALSLAGCALLCTAVYRLTLRYDMELTAEGALPPLADPYHVAMAEGLVDRGSLGWHPWVNRHGYVLAGQRLREFGVRRPGGTIFLQWTCALSCAALIIISQVWDEAALHPVNLILPVLGCAGYVVGALTHRSASQSRREHAEAFREKYEAWGATGDPYFPGFPERGPGRAGPAPARRVTPPGARR